MWVASLEIDAGRLGGGEFQPHDQILAWGRLAQADLIILAAHQGFAIATDNNAGSAPVRDDERGIYQRCRFTRGNPDLQLVRPAGSRAGEVEGFFAERKPVALKAVGPGRDRRRLTILLPEAPGRSLNLAL